MWVMTGMEIENGPKLTHSFFPSSKCPLGPNIIHHISILAFLSFQLVLHCQEAPELFAFKCYLILPKHCQRIKQNLRRNITNLHWQIDSKTGIYALSVLPRCSFPGTLNSNGTERHPMSGNSTLSLHTQQHTFFFGLSQLHVKGQHYSKCRTFYVPFREVKRQRMNGEEGHGED